MGRLRGQCAWLPLADRRPTILLDDQPPLAPQKKGITSKSSQWYNCRYRIQPCCNAHSKSRSRSKAPYKVRLIFDCSKEVKLEVTGLTSMLSVVIVRS